jgi:hypothetical protein
MDPIALAGSFATIVGLVVNFKSERKGQKDSTYHEFCQYLEHHRHEELKKLIDRSSKIQEELNVLLQQDHETMVMKLSKIEEILGSLLKHIEGFSEIIEAIKPDLGLSQEAIFILKALVNSTDDRVYVRVFDGQLAAMLVPSMLLIEGTDPKYLRNDMRMLDEFGLLQHAVSQKAEEIYYVTRNAQRFVKAMENPR